MTASVLFVLLIIAAVSNAIENYECNTIQNLSSSMCTEVIITESQELANAIKVTDMNAILITSSKPINITCTNEGTLIFQNISSVEIRNISFFSCGSESHSNYALQFFNVRIVSLSDIVLAYSSFGALRIDDGCVNISNIVIRDNFINNGSNVVSITNSPAIRFSGVNVLHNNSLETNDTACSHVANVHLEHIKTVLFISSCKMIEIIGSLNVNENFGPSGIVHITKSLNTSRFKGEGHFIHNRVCVNGALYLESTNTLLVGNYSFENNTAHEYYVQARPASVAGIGLHKSHLSVSGELHFIHNHGDVTAMYINDGSSARVNGKLSLTNQMDGYTGIFVRGHSELVINGTGEFLRNRVHNSVLRLESGMLNTTGDVIFDSNYGNSPCSFRIRSTVNMSGSVIFRNNSGVFYVVDSTVIVDGEALFESNSIRDFGIGGAIVLFRSELLHSQPTIKRATLL